ncbi:MAG TPA: ABC transporter ATP-binding protein [Solirubrobacterales bacterium]|nr:ABC transporter ATP-binding protein [Solirubrobacterales bacterium]
MIAVENLHKAYGGRVALDEVTFTVPKGEIFGFVGPNGAGKTTTIRILATLSAADSGDASVGGIPVHEAPAEVRNLIGYMPDFFGVYDRLTSAEYLEFYAACHGVPRRKRAAVARELLELVDLSDRRDAQVDTLSRGMKQRLGLARALVHDPAVLLLDEPASGLDPRARVEMKELIRELRRMGKTILISSHILPELEELCTWVGFIDGGRIVAAGPMAEVRDAVVSGRRLRISLADHGEEEMTRAEELLRSHEGVVDVLRLSDHLEVAVTEAVVDDDLLALLVARKVRVRSFAVIPGDLSEVFLRLTRDEMS